MQRKAALFVVGSLVACGDTTAGGRESAGGTEGVNVTMGDAAGTTAPGDADAGESATPTADGGGVTTNATTSATTGATGGATSTTGADESSSDSVGDDGPRLDTPVPDVPACSGGKKVLDFSYIWVANSAESTVSKIDTETMTELARYITRPDSAGNPSRTSVNLIGDVAVANRAGGIVKYYARAEDCTERNGVPGIQTSTGSADVIAWDDEECRAWYTPTAGNVQRPVAWTTGQLNKMSCEIENQKVWTTSGTANTAGTISAVRLNGDTGAVEVDLPVPELSATTFGPYGGAVDAENNFWFHSRDAGVPHPLVKVDADGMNYQIIDVPDPVNPYGITIDSRGRIWLAGYIGGIGRYDPVANTWQTVPGVTGLGIQEDAQGRMWMAIFPWDATRGVIAFNVDTMDIIKTIDMTAVAASSRGVSIDFNGYVWMVESGSQAFRIDPDLETWEVYGGLNGAYTYSDMTGWGLSLVAPG